MFVESAREDELVDLMQLLGLLFLARAGLWYGWLDCCLDAMFSSILCAFDPFAPEQHRRPHFEQVISLSTDPTGLVLIWAQGIFSNVPGCS